MNLSAFGHSRTFCGAIGQRSTVCRQRLCELMQCSSGHREYAWLAFNIRAVVAVCNIPGIHCNKERQMSARKSRTTRSRADLSDP